MNLFTLLPILLVTFVASTAQAQSPVSLGAAESRPMWIFSGSMDFDEEHFYLVDALNNSLDRYDSHTGALVASFSSEFFAEVGLTNFSPTYIRRVGEKGNGQYVLENGNSHFIWLDGETLRPQQEIHLAGVQNHEGVEISAITTWAVDEDLILAFGDLLLPNGKYFSGYIKVPVEQPGTFEVVSPRIPVSSPVRARHYLGHSFSRSLDLGIALIEENPRPHLQIVSADEIKEVSLPVPKQFKTTKPWAKWNSETNTRTRFKDFERASAIVDVFGDSDFIYLVRKAGVAWFLDKIDRETEALRTKRLPTADDVAHLVIIPGLDSLVTLQKKEVRSAGDQQIAAFLNIDLESWFE